jgi:polyribonucleotide nucleotidyltransferase
VAADVDSEATYSLQIPARFHGQLIGPGGQNLRDIIANAGGPSDSRAAAQLIQFPRKNADSSNADTVQVRGPAEVAAKVKEELERIVADLNDRIVVGVVVAPSQQRSLMGRIRELQSVHKSAKIVVPSWKEYNQLEVSNASELQSASPESIVRVGGSPSACKALQAEIAESFSSNSKTMQVPRAIAQRLASGNTLRQIRSEYGVQIDAPRMGPGSDSTSSKAPAGRIDADETDPDDLPFELTQLDLSSSEGSVTWSLTGKTMSSLEEAVKELQGEINKLKTCTTQGRLWVDQRAIPRIVGRGGSGLRDIENQTDTLIEIPRDAGGLVTILGSQDSVEEARQRIARIASQRGRE